MSTVELVPVSKGNPVIVDNAGVIILGRIPSIGCSDIRVSRKHAELFIKSDGTIWIKPIHHNPIFYKTKSNQIVSLTKDKEYQLHENDQFGLLPDEYFYRISIQSNDKLLEQIIEQDQTINSTTSSKSPIKEKESLLTDDHNEEKALQFPNQSSDSSASTLTNEIEPSQENLTPIPSLRKRIHPEDYKPTEKTDIDDDDEDYPKPTASSAEQLTTTTTTTAPSTTTTTTAVKPKRRDRCEYGKSCYRTNPIHRQQESHPEDSDWDSDEEETKPECPFGSKCYRKNPDHFEEYYHPKTRSTDVKSKQYGTKRKADNDYDDEEDTISTDQSFDQEETDDDDSEWEPEENSQKYKRTDDNDDDDTSDQSDKELTKREAEEFVRSSVVKKPRLDEKE